MPVDYSGKGAVLTYYNGRKHMYSCPGIQSVHLSWIRQQDNGWQAELPSFPEGYSNQSFLKVNVETTVESLIFVLYECLFSAIIWSGSWIKSCSRVTYLFVNIRFATQLKRFLSNKNNWHFKWQFVRLYLWVILDRGSIKSKQMYQDRIALLSILQNSYSWNRKLALCGCFR